IRSRFDRLDVLINNAAVISRTYETGADGFEMQWAVNHLAPFLLTNLLLDMLRQAEGSSRIVNVSSRVHAGADADFWDAGSLEKEYHPTRVYGRTKLANILFTFELARRLAGSSVTANCLHPGVIATNLLADFRGRPRLLTKLVRRHARTTNEGS